MHAARQRFIAQWGILSTGAIHVVSTGPLGCGGLQAVDYFLWALQPLYERREDRHVTMLWPAFRLVHDLDDTREAAYGVYYSQREPLTLAALGDLPGICDRSAAAKRSHGMEPNFIPWQIHSITLQDCLSRSMTRTRT